MHRHTNKPICTQTKKHTQTNKKTHYLADTSLSIVKTIKQTYRQTKDKKLTNKQKNSQTLHN